MPEPLKAVIPHWEDVDVTTLESRTLITGIEAVEELDMVSKLLGAQMLAMACGGAVAEYLGSERNRASPHFPGKATTITRRFHESFAVTNPSICFADSQVHVSYVQREPGPQRYSSRRRHCYVDPAIPQKVSRLHIATATRLVAEDESTGGFTGVKFVLDLGYKNKKVTRMLVPGVSVASRPEKLYPYTATFAFE